MNRRIVCRLLTILLLTGCATTRPVDSKAVAECNCNKAVAVPDKVFRTFLIDKGFAENAGLNRLKPTAKGCEQKELECYKKGIHSLEGIAMFPQLEQVVCSDNPITELNLNGLPNLKELYGLNLPLKSIHLEQCNQLKLIQLSHTELDTFDLSPFPQLEEFFCIFSPLRHIDLSPCPKMQYLYIRGTMIREVDLRPCRTFNTLHALDTPLEKIILTPEQYDGDTKASVEDTVKVVVRPLPEN